QKPPAFERLARLRVEPDRHAGFAQRRETLMRSRLRNLSRVPVRAAPHTRTRRFGGCRESRPKNNRVICGLLGRPVSPFDETPLEAYKEEVNRGLKQPGSGFLVVAR